MLTTCESANDVPAWMIVATMAMPASGSRSSERCLLMTSSIRNFDVYGSTIPENRLTTISARPMASEPRCSEISSRASAHARDRSYFAILEIYGAARPVHGLVYDWLEAKFAACEF